MTSEQNKLLPKLKPKRVIGIQRRPIPRDLYDRRDPSDQRQLQGLPDPDADGVLRRAALNLGQAAVNIQQSVLEMNPVAALRDSLHVLPEPDENAKALADALAAADGESELDDGELKFDDGELEFDDEDAKALEDAFIAKVRGGEVEEVAAAGVGPVPTRMQVFVKKVRSVKKRGAIVPPPTAAVPPPTAAVTPPPPPAARPDFGNIQPGTTRELTVAEAALALTNEQAGTNVTMEELMVEREMEDDEVRYRWTVGNVETRELTVAEAALVLTNMQAGTNLTMEDLRTAREMVDLWDNEDTFQWTVGDVE